MLCDRMTCNNKMVSIFRHGINNDDIGPLAKASFEETPEMFLKAAKHGELDMMKGVSANIMCGQLGYYGTNSFKLLTDLDFMMSINKPEKEEDIEQQEDINIEQEFKDKEEEHLCSINNLIIDTNISNIKVNNMGNDTDYDIGF